MSHTSKIAVVILAAGQGKRMNSPLPKVMHLLKDKPIIGHIVSAFEKVESVGKIIVVVPSNHTLIQDYLGNRVEYCIQTEQKGTGHAVQCTEDMVRENFENVIVIYGDLPCISTESLDRLVEKHVHEKNQITMMTTPVQDYNEWRAPFLTYGRIVRNTEGSIQEIVEYKDANEQQKNILEVNSGVYCFRADWLFEQLKYVNTNNAQSEFYLTDVVKMALEREETVNTVLLNPQEAIGVTTQEDIKVLESLS